MKLLHSLALVGALALATATGACSTIENATGQCVDDPVCTAQKALTTGYNSHDALVNIAKANHDSGALVGDNYNKARTYLDDAKSYLDKAYAVLHAAGTFDAALFNSDMTNANVATGNANALVTPGTQ